MVIPAKYILKPKRHRERVRYVNPLPMSYSFINLSAENIKQFCRDTLL